MFYICALLDNGDFFNVWYFKDTFKVSSVSKTDNVVIDDREYKDYKHFWGVYGKFNPEIGFLPQENWVAIKELSYSELGKIKDKFSNL